MTALQPPATPAPARRLVMAKRPSKAEKPAIEKATEASFIAQAPIKLLLERLPILGLRTLAT